MCDPISIAGAAAMAAGTLMKMSAQASAQRSESEAVGAETTRQQGFRDRGGTQLEATRAATTEPEFQRRLQEGTTQREQAYRAATPTFDPNRDYLPGQQNAPQVVRDVVNARVGDAVAMMNQEASRRAAANAWGDATIGNQTQLARGQEGQGLLQNFARGSSSILPFERTAAQSKAASPIGDLLVGVGSAALGAGGGIGALTGGGAAGAGSTPAWLTWARTPVWDLVGNSAARGAAGAAGAAGGGAVGSAFSPTTLPFGGT